MRRALTYVAAAALLATPWVVQGVQSSPTGSATVAICYDDGKSVAPVAYVTPLGADRPATSSSSPAVAAVAAVVAAASVAGPAAAPVAPGSAR